MDMIVELVRRFARAVAAADEVSARALCAADAWHARASSMYQLYRQLTGRGRSFGLRVDGAPRASESTRAAVHCTVMRATDEPVSGLVLMCEHIPARLAGWTRSPLLVERYLSNAVPADFGLHTLIHDPAALAGARALADDLARGHAGDRAARDRLAHAVGEVGSDPVTLVHLQMCTAAGARLTIDAAARLPVLERVLVRARWSRAGDDRAEPIWLYAERDHLDRLCWLGHRAVFDIDALLCYRSFEGQPP